MEYGAIKMTTLLLANLFSKVLEQSDIYSYKYTIEYLAPLQSFYLYPLIRGPRDIPNIILENFLS